MKNRSTVAFWSTFASAAVTVTVVLPSPMMVPELTVFSPNAGMSGMSP